MKFSISSVYFDKTMKVYNVIEPNLNALVENLTQHCIKTARKLNCTYTVCMFKPSSNKNVILYPFVFISDSNQKLKMEVKKESPNCHSSISCAFCRKRKDLKDMFGKNESTSRYSQMIMRCFNIEVTINSVQVESLSNDNIDVFSRSKKTVITSKYAGCASNN